MGSSAWARTRRWKSLPAQRSRAASRAGASTVQILEELVVHHLHAALSSLLRPGQLGQVRRGGPSDSRYSTSEIPSSDRA